MSIAEKYERQIARQIKDCDPNAYRSALVGKIVDDLIKERGRTGAENVICAVIKRVKSRIKRWKAEGQDTSGQKIFLKWLGAMRAKIRPEWLLEKQIRAIDKKQPKPHRPDRDTRKRAKGTSRGGQAAHAQA